LLACCRAANVDRRWLIANCCGLLADWLRTGEDPLWLAAEDHRSTSNFEQLRSALACTVARYGQRGHLAESDAGVGEGQDDEPVLIMWCSSRRRCLLGLDGPAAARASSCTCSWVRYRCSSDCGLGSLMSAAGVAGQPVSRSSSVRTSDRTRWILRTVAGSALRLSLVTQPCTSAWVTSAIRVVPQRGRMCLRTMPA
jgi:hypothetical protein